ncbi:MAG: hypothetical protein KUL85_12680 [Sphingobacterium mizutaii]|nr:hypothetical protein [Sphingobacterium mizutaii]
MKTKFLMILLAFIIFGAGSCKKGDQGEMGPEGAKGDKGDKGVTGAKGADGSMIYSGTALPATSLGKNGDYYFRTTTGDLYGPKASSGWGSPTKLKGADGKNGTNGTNGSNGKNGSQFLSGTTIPAVTLGAVGDFYFNTAQMVLYGPKTSTGWGVGTNLKANVKIMYSGWRNVVRMVDTAFDNTRVRAAHIYEPQLTKEVLANSAILVYLDYGQGAYPLPYTSYAINRMSTITFHPKLRELVIMRMAYDGGPTISMSSYILYRYVIIPGNFYISMKKRGVNLKDPVAVERAIQELKE